MTNRTSPLARRLAAATLAATVTTSLVLTGTSATASTTAVPTSVASAQQVDRSWGPFSSAPYGAYSGDGLTYPSTQTDATYGLDVADATAGQSTGVVMISTVVDFGTGAAAGTGMVLDGDAGIVVTNHHVVEGSTEVEVTVPSSGETYTAEVLGTDATHDVAVLQLQDAPALDEISTDTTGVAAGDDITAVGDAGGDGGTLTAAGGTVTDAHEPVTVTDDDGTETTIHNLVEVNADIIPGDSGGALLDGDGDVVAMNVAASSGNADITGYAIPVARVLRIARQILTREESATVSIGYDAFLGVQLATGTSSATIAGVLDGGAAQDAGLGTGDTIISIDGTPVSSANALSRAIRRHQPDETVSVTWTDTAGARHTTEVVLGMAPVA